MPTHGKKLTLLFATLAVVVLGAAGWIGWPWIQFYWRFEPLGLNDKGFPEYRHRMTGIVMVRLPGGTFWMGAQKEDPEGRNYDPMANEEQGEGPVHAVELSPFLIAKYEVTQGQWKAVMGNYPSYFDGTTDNGGNPVDPPDDRDRLPVEQVSWDDIQEFEAASGLLLPTEAQWEYACRAGSTTAYSFGSDTGSLSEYCWYSDNSGYSTHPVSQKRPNEFGLFDMYGNVWERCEDVYDSDFYSTPEAAGLDPVCTSGSGFRVMRGGGCGDHPKLCRSANRSGIDPGLRASGLGIRPAAPCP